MAETQAPHKTRERVQYFEQTGLKESMESSLGRKTIRNLCIASMLVLLAAVITFAQATTGVLRGQLTDPSGELVVDATVLLTTPSGGSMDTKTNKEGIYEFKDLPPGTYEVKAVATSFAMFDKPGVVIRAGQTTALNIALTIEVQQEKVEVNATSTQLDTNPASNANAIVLQGKDLDALSDDPDELESQLQALAGPSAGPNGGQIYIDGFTAGQLPPKASIREIRINQNPFSAEYDKLGYGRIEILTKPGTDKLHGQVMFLGNSSAFNARNPFEVLPEGESPPDYHSTQFSANVGGAINKKTSFFFNYERRDIQDLAVVSATVLDPNFNIVPFSAALANPQTRNNVSSRLDYQVTPNNTLTARYQYWRDSENNNGTGGFFLAETGSNELSVEHTVQLTDTDTINASTINEIRFQYVHASNDTIPLNLNPEVTVGGAFNGNGSGGGNIADLQNRYELQEMVFKNIGKHSFKFGGRLRGTKDVNTATELFNGQFSFGSRERPGCVVSPTDNCLITPIEAYQITEQGLANGLTIPQIQNMGGGASFFTQNIGAPTSAVTLIDVGLWAQDDWKVRQNVTITYGVRFEGQNNLANKADFAPRLGFAWGIGGSAKNPPRTVLRGGFGMFYDRFTYDLALVQDRFNGFTQQQFLVQNPAFYLGNIPPATALPIATAPTRYVQNSVLHAPYTIQTGVTLERQLGRAANVAFTYLNSRGVHQLYINNLNPADPITGLRPDPEFGNLFQYQSEATFKQRQFIVNGSVRMGAKLSLFGYYVLNYSNSDSGGASTYASNPFNLQQDYGRSIYDIRNRLFMGGTFGLPRGFRLSPFMIASSGIPFNITTGQDLYQDNVFNTRPSFATCSAATQTKFGCFDASPAPGATPIPINYATGPGRFTLNARLSKTFGFGPAVENAASGGGMGGPGAGGTFGRGPGGGPGGRGGGGGMRGSDVGATNHRYSLTAS
ncbi:MAG TPA: carboxypeptidase regulatory-like domain-containing protein, partial [Candidatus Acidoferrum sp.]